MSGVIKAGERQAAKASLQPVAFNFEDISTRANQYLDAVRRQAAQILVDTKQQARVALELAKDQGRKAALREAEQSVQGRLDQQLTTLLPALGQAVAEIRHAQQAWLRHWEQRTVELACAIAERIIRRELQTHPEITLGLVREALELALGGGRVRLHLNPQDCETLRSGVSLITGQLRDLGPAEIVADPEISAGGCRVVTEFGSVDQRIETQLARIAEELT